MEAVASGREGTRGAARKKKTKKKKTEKNKKVAKNHFILETEPPISAYLAYRFKQNMGSTYYSILPGILPLSALGRVSL